MINIKTAYGAVGDGTTDDTTAFQNCAAACAGQEVLIPKGQYLIKAMISWPDCQVVGEGKGGTIIKMGSPFTYNHAVFYFPSGGVCKDMSLDGDSATQATKITAMIYGPIGAKGAAQLWLDNLSLYDFNCKGIACNGTTNYITNCHIDGSGQPTNSSQGPGIYTDGTDSVNIIIGCTVINCNIGGIAGNGHTQVIGCTLWGNHRETTPYGGAQIGALSSAKSMAVIGCNIFDGGAGASGMEVANCPWRVVGNRVYNNPNWGIILQSGSDHIIDSNHIYNNGYIGIDITAGIARSIVTGNIVRGNASRGLKIDSGATEFIVNGNNFNGNTVGAVLNNGGTAGILKSNLPVTVNT